MSWLTVTHHNFCWTNRMLRVRLDERRYSKRSPAMAAGLVDHVWTVEELVTRQVLTRSEPCKEGAGESIGNGGKAAARARPRCCMNARPPPEFSGRGWR
jgi:hypothetical protein